MILDGTEVQYKNMGFGEYKQRHWSRFLLNAVFNGLS